MIIAFLYRLMHRCELAGSGNESWRLESRA